ncbi:MAG: helix-turn-helix transcriptional regulator, partial [Pusillimonas sp.]|nr:helix-turn-helix transcriptional regulator [Pusillimonas sp.]
MNTLPDSLQPVPLRTEREISVLLNGLRKQQKISQKELGKRLGLQQSRVSELLSNPTAMRVEQFMQILAILGM